ncbi:hypothetical protein [Kineococcus rhizosphaerae]|uniref:Uncharacterized protein n=1 Tax=Kineococcus rhizosphaerae TaxID=559628 RepID=A0A2T0RA53_9ACTN|nr:hypothetical protein [Kineococcus rhizosphaerae]PRY18046.1 hypothetical protein CLV37_101290 [Kineococcus rhizosphaerae]
MDLPRSARLAAWGTGVLSASVPLEAAVAAVVRDDEPHTVRFEDAALPRVAAEPDDVPSLLAGLGGCGATGLLLALPVPGDPRGLPGPAAVNVAALEAGECVVAEVAGHPERWALVPAVTEFGSAWEPGAFVTWTVRTAAPRRAPESSSVAESERELRVALQTATQALASLDVARWREEAADRIAAVRDGALVRDAVPPGTSPRALRVLQTAARVLAIVDLATEDDGAAITSLEATSRAAALREVAAVARRALVAAVNAHTEPARP